MPLTSKGEEIKEHMEKEYGEKKGEEVFYASRNKGTISGVDGVGMECADQPGISPYYGDPPLDPTSIAPPPGSSAEQPSGMKEPIDNSTFNPPPLGDAIPPRSGGSGSLRPPEEMTRAEVENQLRNGPHGAFPERRKERLQEALRTGSHKDTAGDAEMSPSDAFAAFGARADQSDAWLRMTGSKDFSGDEHSRMGKLPTEIGFRQMRSMAEGFGYNQGFGGDPYKK